MRSSTKQSMAALATVFIAGQLSYALPASSGTRMISRAEEPLVPGLYGESGKPESADLLDVIRHASTEGDMPKEAMMSLPLHEYATMLWAFTKSDANWVKSWFPTKEELDRLTEIAPLSEGRTYVLRHDDEGDKRHAVDVSRDWYKGEEVKKLDIKLAPDVESDNKVGWWPWALLEAGYKDFKYATMVPIVRALSGENLQLINSKDPAKLWEIIKNGESSPIWLRLYDDKWYVVMTAKGKNADDAIFSLGGIDGMKYSKFLDIKLADAAKALREVFYLEGFPTWKQQRKGDIEF